MPFPAYMPLTCTAHDVDESSDFAAALGVVIDNPDNEAADVVFEVGGRRFGGVRALLSFRCDVFKRMLQGEFREAAVGSCVPFPQFDHAPGAFRELLRFLHTGRASLGQDVLHVYELADYFQAHALKDQCFKFITKGTLFNKANAISILAFMERYDCDSKAVQNYIMTNADVILKHALTHARHSLELIPPPFLMQLF